MRRYFLGLLGLGGLAAVALAWLLIPAHLQIRRIEPPLPQHSEILAALAGTAGPEQLHFINTASQDIRDEPSMSYPAFLLSWADGRRFMIDTGMEREAARSFGKPLEWLLRAEPMRPYGSVGEQMQAQSIEVQGVALTHMHTDHAGGIRSLCGLRSSPLPVFQRPLQSTERNHTTEAGRTLISESGCADFVELDGGSIAAIPGFPGIVAVAAAGHTPGSTIYFSRVGEQLWIFAGDITNSRAELEDDIPKQFLYSLFIVPEYPERQAALRAWLRDLDAAPETTVVVSHDLAALQGSGISSWR
ncbi:MAG: MBL fold metallo-hydrolase [Myxococcota bacterium]|nr:MBL fold metallo-hydrolase [Myxococcota bacterium]